jgi:hypothetical protein
MSIVGNIISGFMGAGAAQSAGNTITAGANAAQRTLANGQTNATNALAGAAGTETAGASPYTSLGGQSANPLASLLAPGGALTQGYGSFSAPTAAQAAATPGCTPQESE